MRPVHSALRSLVHAAASILRSPALALTVAFASPAVCHSTPILSVEPGTQLTYNDFVGWTASGTTYSIDHLGGQIYSSAADPQETYSTASSLYALHAAGQMGVTASPSNSIFNGEMQIDAIVQGNDTFAGNLLGGTLTIRSGPSLDPISGIASGTPLAVGYAIDSAALPGAYDTAFLFALTYTHPLLSSLGSYVTFFSPTSNTWGNDKFPEKDFRPWGRDVPSASSFTGWQLVATRLVPEPSTVTLVVLGCIAIGFVRRRSQGRA